MKKDVKQFNLKKYINIDNIIDIMHKFYIIYIFKIFLFGSFLFISIIQNVDVYLIQKNLNQKICADCTFFISNKKECSKFGNIDIISGKYDYEQAINVRKDEEKCGEEAIFFKKNYLTFIPILFDFFLENNIIYTFLFLVIFLYFL